MTTSVIDRKKDKNSECIRVV